MTSSDLHQQYLETLSRLGGSTGNVKLREALGWDEPTYDSVHAELKALAKIVPGRGRGGSVSIPGVDAPLPEPVPTASDDEIDSFLGALTRAGGASGNVTMRALLGWDEDLYFRVQKALIALGKITTGKGRGGSVQLAGKPAPKSLFDDISGDANPKTNDFLPPQPETSMPIEEKLAAKMNSTAQSEFVPLPDASPVIPNRDETPDLPMPPPATHLSHNRPAHQKKDNLVAPRKPFADGQFHLEYLQPSAGALQTQ